MPSQALTIWLFERAARLDELEAAHEAVGGSAPGRRYATAQLNLSYTSAIAAEFQGFCRDLHSESSQAVVDAVPSQMNSILRRAFSEGRALDRKNATESSIKDDFGRLGLVDIWNAAGLGGTPQPAARVRLEQLNIWRNAIAHSDFTFSTAVAAKIAGTNARLLQDVRRWRRNCALLAAKLDDVLLHHVSSIAGKPPWT